MLGPTGESGVSWAPLLKVDGSTADNLLIIEGFEREAMLDTVIEVRVVAMGGGSSNGI